MRIDAVIMVPEFDITFTRKDIRLIERLARGHYDSRCNELATGKTPTWLTSCLTQMSNNRLRLNRTLTWRDLDLLGKVLEQGSFLRDPKELGAVSQMFILVNRLMHQHRAKVIPTKRSKHV